LGEREAIALARELGAALLVDEREARREAGRLGVRYFGSLGVLKEAKDRGIIPVVKLALDELRVASCLSLIGDRFFLIPLPRLASSIAWSSKPWPSTPRRLKRNGERGRQAARVLSGMRRGESRSLAALGMTPAALGMTPAALGMTPAALGMTPAALGMTPAAAGK